MNILENPSIYELFNIRYSIYILNINDKVCKYGKTSNLYQRIKNHKSKLKFKNIIKIYICKSEKQIDELEKYIKYYCLSNKYNSTFNNQIEIFKIDFLDKVIQYIDNKYFNMEDDICLSIGFPKDKINIYEYEKDILDTKLYSKEHISIINFLRKRDIIMNKYSGLESVNSFIHKLIYDGKIHLTICQMKF